ncbi:hypothetical protein [Cyclobacterium jeungdonense]|uniref:Uncharacterized protein n=1 Tax=Cyclobacterium jeungdonense TaxID=708087 RepID=A0ABT8CAB0_9BACT|nr:hypothetical protein [Cyclobacterium jeungdonense]MDN3689441.1 hypothetical protein [Cyclobacterium jeungdonense]
MKLTVMADGRNSPNKGLVANLTVYFATGGFYNALKQPSETIEWIQVDREIGVEKNLFLRNIV